MSNTVIKELLAYPVAGGGAMSVENGAELLQVDRRYVVANMNNLSERLYQNRHPLLSVIRPEITSDGSLILSVSSEYEDPERFGQLVIPLDGFSPTLQPMEKLSGSATAYPRHFEAQLNADPKVSDWLSALLGGGPYNLARIERGKAGSGLSRLDMNDCFHLVDERSLNLLNLALMGNGDIVAIPMNRFRGNFITDGPDTWVTPEDLRWKVVKIEGFVFAVTPTQRCVYVTKDQNTGETMGKEPLAYLAKAGSSVWDACFGVYLHLNTHGGADFSAIRVGSVVKSETIR